MYSRPAHPDIHPEPLHVPVIQPAEVAVELRDLGRAFAGTQAIDGLNLRIPGGEFLALLGASGCGKTRWPGG